MAKRLTVQDKILLAALDLVRLDKTEFSAEDLVVAAWKKYPDTFGLAGYVTKEGVAKYPDSNRVFAEIMGSKPLRKQGHVRKVGRKLYELTDVGRDKAEFLAGIDAENTPSKASLPRSIEIELRRLLSSRVIEKLVSGQNEDISFYDACTFWGITPRSSAIELEGRLESTQQVIRRASEAVVGGAATFEHGGDTFTDQQLDLLSEADSVLRSRFDQELAIIRKRTDER